MSRHSHTVAPPPELLSGDADAELLAKLGYKQELRRNFTMIEVFGIAFSIMGLLPSIASTLSFSIPAGPVGMVWGWFVASMFIFVVGVAMADLGSAMPTSGGLYWWTHFFASPRTRNALSFLVGYSNTLGLVGGLCSIDYGFALMFCSVIVISRDGNWTPTNGDVYAVFLGCVLLHGVLASTLPKIMGKLQTVFVAMNLILIAATIISLPIGKHQRNDAHYIFAQTENSTTWPTGWAFMLSWLSPIWTIGSFDSCVHMSEEAANAAKAVPYGIMMSIGSCWILGFIIMIVIAACINPDLESVLGSSFGQPMAQIYYDAIGKHGTLGLMSLLMIVQFVMGLSILVAASRQTWAFSRDGALPFSSFFRIISQKMGFIPLRCVWGCVFLAAILGLLCLIAPAAASALFSLAVAGNNVAWGTPLLCRLVWGQHKFVPGPFYTGDKFSRPIAWLAILFLVFGIILAMFPVGGPNPTPQNMNYTVVINMAVWGGALAYYFIDARKWFTGPKITVDVGAMTDEQRQTLADEGLGITVNEGDTTPGYVGGVKGDKIEKGVESA
ncbi:gaba permease [Acephala macrosclerotiorum]|nr:gaba permease [Acephala macrosclerotiorum]